MKGKILVKKVIVVLLLCAMIFGNVSYIQAKSKVAVNNKNYAGWYYLKGGEREPNEYGYSPIYATGDIRTTVKGNKAKFKWNDDGWGNKGNRVSLAVDNGVFLFYKKVKVEKKEVKSSIEKYGSGIHNTKLISNEKKKKSTLRIDLNNDGKKEKIELVSKGKSNEYGYNPNRYVLSINGVSVSSKNIDDSFDECYEVQTRWFYTKGKEKILVVNFQGINEFTMKTTLYQWTGKKIKVLKKFMGNKTLYSANPNKDTVTFYYCTYPKNLTQKGMMREIRKVYKYNANGYHLIDTKKRSVPAAG